MKLAAIHGPLGSFGRPLLALGVTIIFALALESGVALGMGHGGGGAGGASTLNRTDEAEGPVQSEAARTFAGAAVQKTAPASSEASPTEWVPYHNSATGLAFRYPPPLRIRERDPRSFGLPDAEEITELVGDTHLNPGTIVLRFIVKRGETTPEMAAAKARATRERYARDTDHRESLSTMQLDGHEALVEVFCGARGPACHWGVNVLQPRDCLILSLLAGADFEEALPPPHDGLFPLLSIIRTVHFHMSAK